MIRNLIFNKKKFIQTEKKECYMLCGGYYNKFDNRKPKTQKEPIKKPRASKMLPKRQKKQTTVRKIKPKTSFEFSFSSRPKQETVVRLASPWSPVAICFDPLV